MNSPTPPRGSPAKPGVGAETARAHLLHVLALTVPALKTAGTFDSHLWGAALQMFRDGNLSPFLDVFVDEIRNQLTRAFNQGARDVGVDPSEFTADDLNHLEGWINSEYNYVLNLAQAIQDLHMTGVSIEEFRTAIRWRIGLWANRFNEVANEARIYFGGKQRLVWQMGDREEHCETCVELNGMIAFAEEWYQAGIRPQEPPNRHLKCKGWQCGCRLTPTDRPRSPRAFDRLTDLALANYL